jgi:hypothetical protein
MGPTLHAALGLRAAYSMWSADARAWIPITHDAFRASEGSGEARPYLFSVGVDRVLWTRSSWSAELGAGGGVLVLLLRSDPATGYVGKSDRLASGLLLVQGELAGDIVPWMWWRASLAFGACVPRAVVRFDGREVASWGQAFAAGVVALYFGVPRTASGVP